jgi:hypothetical protein
MSKNIFRQKRTRNFTVVPNEFLHSRTLSFKSKGILTYLLSLPSDWELHVSHLATISTDGRDSVYNGIQELIEAKYIWRRPRSGIEPGGWEYFVYDAPELDCPFGEKPHTENPHTEKPDTENPESGKPATTKYYLSKERTKGEQKPEEQTTDSEFESFYSSYPRKVAKPQAKKAWSKNKCVLAEVLPALEQHKKTWKDPQFVPYPATWLNQRRWEDETNVKQESSVFTKQESPVETIKNNEWVDDFWTWLHQDQGRTDIERDYLGSVEDRWLVEFIKHKRDLF